MVAGGGGGGGGQETSHYSSSEPPKCKNYIKGDDEHTGETLTVVTTLHPSVGEEVSLLRKQCEGNEAPQSSIIIPTFLSQ